MTDDGPTEQRPTEQRPTEQRLADWNERLSTALGVPPAPIEATLGLAGVIAHGVVRPAAPLSTYLVGFAAGLRAANGASPDEAFAWAEAIARTLASGESTE
ncbi:hypothetical protein BH11ACT2_BH11ACT2_16540 [soil metagenome]